ncbi:IclR family transcriptional regulator [Dactylosporangium sp. NPDC048998]|uniref:IclR family transcriptional regulator n=1 Tax=Dactylosporangium sp. NPDC048998 TaxID=3363976 RepID=UPI003712F3BB
MTVMVEQGRDDRAAVDKAIDLLSSFGGHTKAGLGVSELARRSSMSKSTAFRLLGVLERNGVVERVGSNYRLGARLHSLGIQVYTPEGERLRDLLTPFLADLYELTHETVHLAMLDGPDVVYLAKLFGHRPVPSPSKVGGRVPAHRTAVGKALLAFDPAATDLIASMPLTGLTPFTLTDHGALLKELAAVRQDGIAFDRQEARIGLTCVAAPVFGPSGVPIAGLSVSGATGRFVPAEHAVALRRVSLAASQRVRRAR